MLVSVFAVAGVLYAHGHSFLSAPIEVRFPASPYILAQASDGVADSAQATVHHAQKQSNAFGFDNAFATSLTLLGDLYRDGRIASGDGMRALTFYRSLKAPQDRSRLNAFLEPASFISAPGAIDAPKALSLYHEVASSGNVDALLRLGSLYAEGRVVAKDYGRAFAFYSEAAEAGSDEGTLRVGEMTALGRGTSQEIQQGVAMVQKLADAGNVEALVLLGDFYRPGELDVANDPGKAVGFYRRAASLGSDQAKLRIGEMLVLGQGVPRNVSAGIAMINEVVARTGDAAGLVLLGTLYSSNNGGAGTFDLKKAFDYFKQAAQKGDETGALRMAEMLARGQGTAQDFNGGRDVLATLAGKGNPFALVSLGDLLSDVTLASVDVKSAAAAYERAAAFNHTFALVRLGDLYSRNGAVPSDFKSAYSYYQQAAAAGDVAGKLRVGEMKMFGQGTGRDVEAGLAAVKALADAGDPDSLLFLGDLYQRRGGNVIQLDSTKSYDYFRKAAEAGSVLGKIRAGEMLARGEGVAQDVTAGRDLVHAIAELDNPVGLASYGDLLTDRRSGPIDLAGAQSAYERAAALGRADALVRLGDIFRAGTIVAGNPAVALRYYERAAAAGELMGRLRVGEMTVLGEGTTKNVEAGLALVKHVADAGDDYAYVVLGDLCLSINTEAALAAYEQAAKRGRIDALLRLGDLYRSGRGVPVDGKKAAEYYLRAANAEAMAEDMRGANESN